MTIKGTAWVPTTRLRFVDRDGKRILQQRWIMLAPDKHEWRDVPLEPETT